MWLQAHRDAGMPAPDLLQAAWAGGRLAGLGLKTTGPACLAWRAGLFRQIAPWRPRGERIRFLLLFPGREGSQGQFGQPDRTGVGREEIRRSRMPPCPPMGCLVRVGRRDGRLWRVGHDPAGEDDSSGRPFRGCGGIYRMFQGLRPAASTPGYIPAALFRAPENAGASVDGGRGAGALVARPGHTRAASCNSMMPADAAVWRRVVASSRRVLRQIVGSPATVWSSSPCGA
jgi:hypothetical protein